MRKVIDRIKRVVHPYVIRARYYLPWVSVINSVVSDIEFVAEGAYLVATKKGLYQILNSRLFLITKGNYYGIALHDSHVYAFERMEGKGRVVRFALGPDNEICDAKVFLRKLSPGCHQIDAYKGALYICDTYNNRILKVDIRTKRRLGEGYPLGKLDEGRSSSNYAHINSIYVRDDDIVVLCHNDSRKTNRPSQIAILKHSLDAKCIVDTSIMAGHNVVPLGHGFLCCDSLHGTLNHAGKDVFTADCFTRGLSITKEHIVLGGSEYAKRDLREYAKGYIYILNRQDFVCIKRVEFPGMVQEIRRLDDVDYGQSAFSLKHPYHGEYETSTSGGGL